MPRIMIVEDEPIILSNLGDIFTMIGLEVTFCADGQYAFENLLLAEKGEAPVPDVILSDLMMPRLDGYALLGLVRAHHEFFQIPFILVSARSDTADLKRAFDMGASDYVVKPFEVDQLIEVVKNQLDGHGARPSSPIATVAASPVDAEHFRLE